MCCGKQTVYYYNPAEKVTREDALVEEWVQEKFDFVRLKDLTSCRSGVNSVLWINIIDKQDLRKIKNNEQLLNRLKSFYDDGGKIVVTNYAAYLPYFLGVESEKPELRKIKIDDYWMFDKRGFQSYMGHPVFSGLFGGTYVFDSMKDTVIEVVGYFGDRFPADGKVVSVDKTYIWIHEKDKLVFEYSNPYGGKLLAFGGYILFTNNFLEYRLKKLLENSFLYLTGQHDGEDQEITYWEKCKGTPKEFTIEGSVPLSVSDLDLDNIDYCGLREETKGSDDYYDLTGRRILVMGEEKGGIREIWAYPFRPFRNVGIGVVDKGVRWLGEDIYPEKVVLRPEMVERYYRIDGGLVKEQIFASYDSPGVVIQIETEKPLKLCLYSKSDFRLMWPYNSGALGGLRYGYDSLSHALHIKSEAGNFYSVVGTSKEPVDYKVGAFKNLDIKNREIEATPGKENEVCFLGIYRLNSDGERLRIVLVGTNLGYEEAIETYRYLMEDAHKELAKQVEYYKSLLAHSLAVISPDGNFNNFWKWAIVGADKFFVETPGLGEGLLAGYGLSTRGWDGGHKVSGRPGYAWYFGRDSEWSSLAIIGYGDFELVKKQLAFLQKYQDLSGKIFHEISTSGVVHYDAADATPLYVILCGEYLRHSGDVKFVEKSWENIKRAMEFLYSTDFDGDGLIENKYIGHGWVEGGKLWGAKTTFYLAALWAQTLKEASYIAEVLGKEEAYRKYSSDYVKVLKIVRENFWNGESRFYNYGIMENGEYNKEPTSIPAVAMCFDLLPEDRVGAMLQAWASHEFCTDWGVRIVSSSSRLFDPTGYHYGSVWPLFTGWTALAEYKYGNSLQAFMKVYSTMRVKSYWAEGYVEEVLNGEEFKPGGVCFHQCWSETGIIHPVVEGMLGWFPDVPHKRILFKPRIPAMWDELKVENMKAGDSVFDFKFRRFKGKLVYEIKRVSGQEMKFSFQPEVPLGMEVIKITLNGKEMIRSWSRERKLLYPPLEFDVKDRVIVEVLGRGGVEPIIPMPSPHPDEKSKSLRMIRESYQNKEYKFVFQGKGGCSYKFFFRNFGFQEINVIGADEATRIDSGRVEVVLNFKGKDFSNREVLVNVR